MIVDETGGMLRIKINTLDSGVHEFNLEPSAEDLELDPGCFSDIQVDARLDVYPERILVHLDMRAVAALECDRTLRPFSQPVTGRYTVLFARPDLAKGAGTEFDDIRALLPGDTEIDLTEAVRDTLMLALPVRRIAPGAEDLEIQTHFGAPAGKDAIDPRWEVLRKLQERDDAA